MLIKGELGLLAPSLYFFHRLPHFTIWPPSHFFGYNLNCPFSLSVVGENLDDALTN